MWRRQKRIVSLNTMFGREERNFGENGPRFAAPWSKIFYTSYITGFVCFKLYPGENSYLAKDDSLRPLPITHSTTVNCCV